MEQNFSPISNQQKNKEDTSFSRKREQVIQEIIEAGNKTGKKVDFIDHGNDYFSYSELNFNEEVLQGLGDQDKYTVKEFVKFFDSYLKSPVILDSFEDDKNVTDLNDISTREGWKRAHLGEDAQRFYNSNRLGRCLKAVNPFIFLHKNIVNPSIKNRLENLEKETPRELLEKVEGEYMVKYYFLSEEEKVRVEKKFSEVLREVVDIFISKHKVNEN